MRNEQARAWVEKHENAMRETPAALQSSTMVIDENAFSLVSSIKASRIASRALSLD